MEPVGTGLPVGSARNEKGRVATEGTEKVITIQSTLQSN